MLLFSLYYFPLIIMNHEAETAEETPATVEPSTVEEVKEPTDETSK
jgi:hypothetical protein